MRYFVEIQGRMTSKNGHQDATEEPNVYLGQLENGLYGSWKISRNTNSVGIFYMRFTDLGLTTILNYVSLIHRSLSLSPVALFYIHT